MDLSTLKISEEAQELNLTNPLTGKKIDVVINVYGLDATIYKRRSRDLYRAILKKSPDGLSEISEEDDERYANRLIAAHIDGWKNIEIDGKEFKYSRENAVKLIKDFPWIKEQVKRYAEKRANFMKAS